MSNAGKWDDHYAGLTEHLAYGDMSYDLIAGLVASCLDVADWGCGGGALADHLKPETLYVGIDGSASPYATVHADLADFQADASAVVLRHVLEHDERWTRILDNAVASFRVCLVIVLFTPLSERTHIAFREPDYHNVPVISFRLEDILSRIAAQAPSSTTVHETIASPDTAFGTETIIYTTR